MAKVDDVAAAILQRRSPMDTWKLQKLVYYCQAWHLVWEGRPLFDDRIEAWANGPVVPSLYEQHRGMYELSEWRGGNPDSLDDDEISTIDAVLKTYVAKTGHWLSALTHREPPWSMLGVVLLPGSGARGWITLQDMLEYYSSFA